MNENELIRRIKLGGNEGEASFKELYETYSILLYRFVFSYVKSSDTAQEITLEALVQLWMHRDNLNEKRSVKSYLFTCCKNSLIKELRRQLKNPNLHDWVELAGNISVESRISYDYDTYRKGITKAQSNLSPRQKQIFQMSREEGLNAGEIAKELGISEQVVRNQLSAAMKKIREYLQRYMPIIAVFYKVMSDFMTIF